MNEKRQFHVLYRNFLLRVIDLELLSASGDPSILFAQFASLLAAFSFVLALVTVPYFGFSTVSHEHLLVGAWGVEEFLISTSLTVTGLFSILAWNGIVPDRRDSFILAPLPVRKRILFASKIAAIATALAISIIAVNIFTGLSLPFVLGGGLVSSWRFFAAYCVTMAAAGGFVFLSIVALQNVMAACLSYPLFQRISGFLQLATFFAILALFFLTPPLASPAGLSSPANQHLLVWLPSYWFLGLFHELNGTTLPWFAPLAERALWSLGGMLLIAGGAGGLIYHRMVQQMMEQSEIAPGSRRSRLSDIMSALTRRILTSPADRAIFLFSARTLARSRQHRLILSVYIGIALAISLAYAKSLVYGMSQQQWSEPGIPLLIVSLVILFFSIVGMRAVFALPIALSSNWIFRITAVCPPPAYFAAARRSLFLLSALPVLLLSVCLYLYLWPERIALQHLLVLVLLAFVLVQALLTHFRKIPFACSYLPGKSNLRLKLGIAGFSFLCLVDLWANIEFWAIDKAKRFLVMAALLVVAAALAKRRNADAANSAESQVQFEDAAIPEIFTLNLRREN